MRRAWIPSQCGRDRLRAQFGGHQLALIAYVPFGDPIAQGEAHLDLYGDAGVSILEIGVPTGDPYLDGPEIEGSMRRALAAGVGPRAIAEGLARWRAQREDSSPAMVWMGYPDLDLASIEFAANLGAMDGLLIVDEHKRADFGEFGQALDSLGVAHCVFVSWDATEDELRAAHAATGYVMVQARPGPTGTSRRPSIPGRQVAQVRKSVSDVPVVAGFGIQDATSLRRVAGARVDGVVVGSACVKALCEGGGSALSLLLRSLKEEVSSLSRHSTTRDRDD